MLEIAIRRSLVVPCWAGLLLAVVGPLYVIGPGFVPHQLNRSESEKASLPLPAKQTA